MKTLQYTLICAFSVFATRSSFANEEILPWDALNSEKQFRSTVESRFPDLQFGFYHWNGDWIIGALEDFDQHRILVLIPSEGVGQATVSRNGKDIELLPGKPENLKIYGSLITPEGRVNNPDNTAEQRIGYWINLEATDTFSIKTKLTWPCEGEFEATYTPDSQWKTSFRWDSSKQNKKEPADAYEISRRSLLKRVLEVLKEQETCLVRLKQNLDIDITMDGGNEDAEIEPLYAVLSDKIVVGIGAAAEVKTPMEFERLLELYTAAARAAAVRPEMLLRVDASTDDHIFRATLNALANQHMRAIRIIAK